MRSPRLRAADDGLTLLELLVVMALIGTVSAISVGSLTAYRRSLDHVGSARDLLSTLRVAHERSLSEGRTYCVAVDTGAGSWNAYRSTCVAGGQTYGGGRVRPEVTLSVSTVFSTAGGATLASQPCISGAACVYFQPRGTASAGTFRLSRTGGGGRPYLVDVKGLTGRVSLAQQ